MACIIAILKCRGKRNAVPFFLSVFYFFLPVRFFLNKGQNDYLFSSQSLNQNSSEI